MAERNLHPYLPQYDEFLAWLRESNGSLRLNSVEALVYWIAALQRLAAEGDFDTGTGLQSGGPKLMVLGMDGDDKLFTEVVLTEDDPENILDETWSPIELWAS